MFEKAQKSSFKVGCLVIFFRSSKKSLYTKLLCRFSVIGVEVDIWRKYAAPAIFLLLPILIFSTRLFVFWKNRRIIIKGVLGPIAICTGPFLGFSPTVTCRVASFADSHSLSGVNVGYNCPVFGAFVADHKSTLSAVVTALDETKFFRAAHTDG